MIDPIGLAKTALWFIHPVFRGDKYIYIWVIKPWCIAWIINSCFFPLLVLFSIRSRFLIGFSDVVFAKSADICYSSLWQFLINSNRKWVSTCVEVIDWCIFFSKWVVILYGFVIKWWPYNFYVFTIIKWNVFCSHIIQLVWSGYVNLVWQFVPCKFSNHIIHFIFNTIKCNTNK